MALLALVGVLLLPSTAALRLGPGPGSADALAPAVHPGPDRVLYVSPRGSDGSSCTRTAPCREIAEAVARAVPGSTVRVLNGVYTGVLLRGLHGTAALPIVLTAPDRGAQVLPTEDYQNRTGAFVIVRSQYVDVEGFRTFHAPQFAVQVLGSDHVSLSNLTLGSDAEGGVLVSASNATTLTGDWIYGSDPGPGVAVGPGSDGTRIVGNTLARNAGPGLAMIAGPSATAPGAPGATIEDNLLFANGGAGAPAIRLEGLRSTLVANNLLYGNGGDGLLLGGSGPGQSVAGVTVAYNTIVDPAPGAWALRIQDTTGPILARDNILVHSGTAPNGIWYATVGDVAHTTSDHNILGGVTVGTSSDRQSLSAWQALGHEPGSLAAVPELLFIDPAASQFELLPGAVAIGHGEPIPGLSTDLLGDPRPAAGPTDIGAFEHPAGPVHAFSIQLTATRISGIAPLTVAFTASAPSAQVPVGYRWNFGDGTNASGPAPLHRFVAAGVYEVTVTAVDRRGMVGQGEVGIAVLASGNSGAPVTFRPVGLPPGANWSIRFGTLARSGVGPLTVPAVAPGTYTAQPAPVLSTRPTMLYAAPPELSFEVRGPCLVNVTFTPYLRVSVAARGPGSAGASHVWVAPGNRVTISAHAAAGAEFVGWVGSGTNSYSGPEASVAILLVDSVLEVAQFRSVALAPIGSIGGGGAIAPDLAGSFAAWSVVSAAVVVGTAVLACGLLPGRRRAPDRRRTSAMPVDPALPPWCEALSNGPAAAGRSPPPWSEAP